VTTRVAGRLLSSEPNPAWLLQNYCALQVLLLRLPRSGSGQSARFHWPVRRYGSKRDISELAVNRQHAWNRNPGRPAIRQYSILPRPCHSPKSRLLVPQGNYGIDASRARGAILQFSHAGRSVRAAFYMWDKHLRRRPQPITKSRGKNKNMRIEYSKVIP